MAKKNAPRLLRLLVVDQQTRIGHLSVFLKSFGWLVVGWFQPICKICNRSNWGNLPPIFRGEPFFWNYHRKLAPTLGAHGKARDEGREMLLLHLLQRNNFFPWKVGAFQKEMDLPCNCKKNRSLRLMAEILHQLIGRLFYYLRGSMHPRWCRMSSINSSKCASCIKHGFTNMPPTTPRSWQRVGWEWFGAQKPVASRTHNLLGLQPQLPKYKAIHRGYNSIYH